MKMTGRIFNLNNGAKLLMVAAIMAFSKTVIGQCSNLFTYSAVPQGCGEFLGFVVSPQPAADSIVFNYGNGETLTTVGITGSAFYNGGSYEVEVTAYHNNGCISTSSQWITVSGLQLSMNEDTVVCQSDFVFDPMVSGGSGNYNYQWTPTLGLNDPTLLNPTLSVNTEQEAYSIIVTDQLNGCQRVDTIIVTRNAPLIETYSLCAGPVTIDLGPGAGSYEWLSFTDTAGNNTPLSYSNTTQAIVVDDPGEYFAYAVFPECGPLTSLIAVEPCVQGCANTFTYTETFGNCGAEHLFAGTADQTVVDWYWDFGDGSTSTLQSPSHVFPGGNYQVSLTTIDINGCEAISTSSLNTNGGFVVDLVQDYSLTCNGMYFSWFYSYTTSGGSGNYTYNWTPEALMDDPTAANPLMTVSYDTWVEVTLTDIQLGCTSVDSMYIYANLPINETLTLCDDSLYLEVSPGSQIYQWSYTDEFGNTTEIQDFDYDLWATQEGTYTCFTYISQCPPTTHTFSVEPCVQGCANTFTYTETFGNCGAEHLFAGTANQTVVDWYWDFGDGSTSTLQSPSHVFLGGTYQVSLATVDINGCQATSTSTISTNGGFGVQVIQDSIFCQTPGHLGGQIYIGSGQYSYEWVPATGLSDPTTLEPEVFSAYEEMYTLTVIDMQSGCTAMDSTQITVQTSVVGTYDLCDGPVTIDLGPGALSYAWQYYTDTNGVVHTLNYPDSVQAIVVDEPGDYLMFAQFEECGAITSFITVEECVQGCANTFTYTETFGNCGAEHLFAGTADQTVVDWYWDFGD
jgi:PKD repeat protein